MRESEIERILVKKVKIDGGICLKWVCPSFIRDRYVQAHPLCEQCLKQGRTTPTEEVHHIIPLSRGGTHSTDNLMSLCQSCHNKIHHDLGDR